MTNRDPYFYGKEVAALKNNPEDTITLRLIIIGVINNILSNHRDKVSPFLSIIRNLRGLYQQIPENNNCSAHQFELIRSRLTEEIVAYNVRPFILPSNNYRRAG
jgi:hypothetical protein